MLKKLIGKAIKPFVMKMVTSTHSLDDWKTTTMFYVFLFFFATTIYINLLIFPVKIDFKIIIEKKFAIFLFRK